MGTERQSTISGFSLEDQEPLEVEEIETTIPVSMYLPEVSSRGFPKNSEVPYINDFDADDSGLSRFLEDEMDNCRMHSVNWKE